jgi:uncharacterized protein YkwD
VRTHRNRNRRFADRGRRRSRGREHRPHLVGTKRLRRVAAAGRHSLATRSSLHAIAHAWAVKLAKAGSLSHNPRLEADINAVCPNWTAIGENVAISKSKKASHVFAQYMHSPPHKANLLDASYRQVGFASVKVVTHGHLRIFNVMDFANHC